MADSTDNVLSHYGVKGMRWGVIRRRDSKTGRVKGSAAPKASSDSKAANKLKKKTASELSNAELKELNKRLQLEVDYARLSQGSNKTRVQKGEETVKKVIGYGQMATQIYGLATHPMTKKGAALIASQLRKLK